MEGCLSSCICCSVVRFSVYYFSHGSCVARVWDLLVWNSAHYAMSSLGFQVSACYFSQCSSIGHTSARPSCVEFCLLCYVVTRFSIFCPLLQSWLCHTCRTKAASYAVRTNTSIFELLHVCMCACARARARVYVCVCVCLFQPAWLRHSFRLPPAESVQLHDGTRDTPLIFF